MIKGRGTNISPFYFGDRNDTYSYKRTTRFKGPVCPELSEVHSSIKMISQIEELSED
jgi:hypothetical protein